MNGQGTRRSIPISNLIIDTQNPRYDPRASQREPLRTIVLDQGAKLLNLAEDIIDRGLNPSDLPIVGETNDPTTFEVLEGNRRLVALKLLTSPALLASLDLPAALAKRYKELQEKVAGTLPTELECVVLPREDANEWIRLKHTGENEGVGVVGWDARARQRFLGSSPARRPSNSSKTATCWMIRREPSFRRSPSRTSSDCLQRLRPGCCSGATSRTGGWYSILQKTRPSRERSQYGPSSGSL